MKKLILIATAFAAALALPINNASAAEAKTIVGVASGAGQLQDPRGRREGRRPGRHAQGPGPFTVFAPTDEAFAKLPTGTVEDLLKPENKAKLHRDPHLPRRRRQSDGRRCEDDEGQDRERRQRST